MNINKILIWVTLFSLIVIIIALTIYKVNENHKANLIEVVTKEVTEAANNCFNEDVCTGDSVTLEELYILEYLKSVVVNPITKEIYSDGSYVIKKEEKLEFIIID